MKNLTKCYCGHTTTCDCGPEEPKQEDMITKIMQMDAKMAYDSLPKQSIKYKILSETSEETKQRVRDNANKLVMKQETLEEAAHKALIDYGIKYKGEKLNVSEVEKLMVNMAKWQQERSYGEEEVIELVQKALTHKDDRETGSLVTAQGQIRSANFFSWFERFKKIVK